MMFSTGYFSDGTKRLLQRHPALPSATTRELAAAFTLAQAEACRQLAALSYPLERIVLELQSGHLDYFREGSDRDRKRSLGKKASYRFAGFAPSHVEEFSQRRGECAAGVGDHGGGLLDGQVAVLLDDLHDHGHHQLQAADAAGFFGFFFEGLEFARFRVEREFWRLIRWRYGRWGSGLTHARFGLRVTRTLVRAKRSCWLHGTPHFSQKPEGRAGFVTGCSL